MSATAALRERTRDEIKRIEEAAEQPHRRGFVDPLDPRLESPLGRICAKGLISKAEFDAGVRWRGTYMAWLSTIGATFPHPGAVDPSGGLVAREMACHLTDEQCEEIARKYKAGCKILQSLGRRVFHAVNAIAVFEEPEELGDFEYTVNAARVGLAALSRHF